MRKIDGFAAEAFNKLVTLRGSEIQTKLRVKIGEKKPSAITEKGRYRTKEEKDEEHCLQLVAAFQRKKNKHLNEVSVKCLGRPVQTNMPVDFIIKCHNDSRVTVYVYVCVVIFVMSCYG